MPTCRKCHAAFPNHVHINGRAHNLQRRKFCLDCSPFGRHNTRDLSAAPEIRPAGLPEQARCSRCKRTLPASKFHRRRDGSRLLKYCRECTNRQVVERQQRLKRLAVEYKGGRCQHCGYDRYVGALEFHHEDGSQKESDVSRFKCTTFEKVKSELDKCLLLCANCHREEHARLKGLIGDLPPLSLSAGGAAVLN
jgi:hypothetical protein